MHFFFIFFFCQPKEREGTKGEIKGGMSSGIVSTNSLRADVMAPRLSPVSTLAVKACWVCPSSSTSSFSSSSLSSTFPSHPDFYSSDTNLSFTAEKLPLLPRLAASSQRSGNGREYISYRMRRGGKKKFLFHACGVHIPSPCSDYAESLSLSHKRSHKY